MHVSPSIASSDILNIAKEIDFIDKYYDNIHIDIEDGVALLGITFGMKMCKRICTYSKSKEKTIHIEVLNPLDFINDLKEIDCECVFIQVSHLNNPIEVINEFKKANIKIGVNFNLNDLNRDNLEQIIETSNDFLISTTDPFDPKQLYLPHMEDFAVKLANNPKYRVWIDGCIDYETYLRLCKTNIHCAVIGRAIFNDKQMSIKRFASIVE